ncbi:Ap4A phosphorylase II [Histoplasma ohiense]|nr:Ap4A phosphorylase II [Histoplasma ohiense (nom. inval.)]
MSCLYFTIRSTCTYFPSTHGMFSGITENLPALVARRFAAAKQSGALVFSQTEVTTISASDTPFQLRYCPALARKPNNTIPQDLERKQSVIKRDPFHDPPEDLLITEFPQSDPSHILVLNKFPVISDHFILATKAYKPQTDLLEKEDLQATFECLKAWQTHGGPAGSKRLFAFFNCGEHSGASQPHRHLQFLPVERMAQPDDGSWKPLIDGNSSSASRNFDHPNSFGLPFACYAVDLPPEPSEDELHRSYLRLYGMALKAAQGSSDSRLDSMDPEKLKTNGPSAISYNLAMTTSRMMICPRRSEFAWLPIDPKHRNDTLEAGLVKLNGTILAGTLMVKAAAEWDVLRNQPDILESVLEAIGFPYPDPNARM